MSLEKRNDQKYIGANVTDIVGATDSAKSLSAGADNYVLTTINSNTGDTGVAVDGATQTLVRRAVLNYDFATDGGAQGEISLRGDSLPLNAVVVKTLYYVTTAFTSGGSATIALNIPTDDAAGLLAATAIGTAGTAGAHDGIQDGAAANVSEITTGIRLPSLTVGTADLTAGALVVYLDYIVPVADTSI